MIQFYVKYDNVIFSRIVEQHILEYNALASNSFHSDIRGSFKNN